MKVRYIGVALAVGIIGIGSFTVLANSITNETQRTFTSISDTTNSELNSTLEGNSRYNEIKNLIDKQVQQGNISEEEGEMLLDYCQEQINTGCNTEEVNQGSRGGC